MAACESSALVHGYRKGRAEERCVFLRLADSFERRSPYRMRMADHFNYLSVV